MKAYRKLAAIWHPDKYDGDDKSKAEKMFIDIASAKEVLTDPGLWMFYSIGFQLTQALECKARVSSFDLCVSIICMYVNSSHFSELTGWCSRL